MTIMIHNNKVHNGINIDDYYIVMNIKDGFYNIVALTSTYDEALNIKAVHGGNLYCDACSIKCPKIR